MYADDAILGMTFAEMRETAREYLDYVNGATDLLDYPVTACVTVVLFTA